MEFRVCSSDLLAAAKSAISTQLLLPHRVATSAMNSISARSWRALKSRGSRTSRKMEISDSMTSSLRIRKPVQNQLLLLTQQPVTHPRFPCPQGGRGHARFSPLFGDDELCEPSQR